MSAPRVAVGSPGRFHSFELAAELEARGLLAGLYTGHPRRTVAGIAPDRLHTFPPSLLPTKLFSRLGLHQAERFAQPWVAELFDWWLERRLETCDVLHCMSGFALRAHRRARERFGALTVCDRGAAHIAFQDDILCEEYARWGIRYPGIPRRIVERELAEYAECDVIAVPSSFVRRTFVERGVPAQRIEVLPLGVDLALFRPPPRPATRFRVLYVGGLTLQKGIPYLLEAMAPLLDGAELWLIGAVHDEVRPFLARYENRIRLLGVMPRNELRRYYGECSVLVLPSVQDGFGMVMAQAMACGLPVVATTNTGATDLYTDGVEGFIVPARSAEALREPIALLGRDAELRRRMGEAALARMRDLGGWHTYGDAVAAVYAARLQRRPPTALTAG